MNHEEWVENVIFCAHECLNLLDDFISTEYFAQLPEEIRENILFVYHSTDIILNK